MAGYPHSLETNNSIHLMLSNPAIIFLLQEWFSVRLGYIRSPYLPTRSDKSRQEVTRGDKMVLDAFTDVYNVIHYILHLFAPART